MKKQIPVLFLAILLAIGPIYGVSADFSSCSITVHTISITDTHDGDDSAELFLEYTLNGDVLHQYLEDERYGLKVGEEWNVSYTVNIQFVATDELLLDVREWDRTRDDSLGTVQLTPTNSTNAVFTTQDPSDATVTLSTQCVTLSGEPTNTFEDQGSEFSFGVQELVGVLAIIVLAVFSVILLRRNMRRRRKNW